MASSSYVVYGRPSCSYCNKAKSLLEKYNKPYQFLPQKQLVGKFATVPQVWSVSSRISDDTTAHFDGKGLVDSRGREVHNNRYIGGFDQLSKHFGQLFVRQLKRRLRSAKGGNLDARRAFNRMLKQVQKA